MERTRLRPSPDVRASISTDGLVLLDVRGGELLASNHAGARIWRLVEQHCSWPDLVRLLAEEYGIAPERADRDAAAFVADLRARGLVIEEERPC